MEAGLAVALSPHRLAAHGRAHGCDHVTEYEDIYPNNPDLTV